MDGIWWEDVDSRYCTHEDFDYKSGETNPDSRFYKTTKNAQDIEIYGHLLLCPTQAEDLYTFGNYNTAEAANFQAIFELCDPMTSDIACADKVELDQWAEDKFIFVVANQKKFI